MTDRLVDFDAFRAEHHKEPLTLKIGGELYALPSSLPAAVAIDVIRLRATLSDSDDVPVHVLDTMGRAVFGADLWQTVLETHRIEVNELPDLLQMVLSAYSPVATDPQTASTPETPTPSSDS